MTPTTRFAHELEPGDEYAPLEFVVTGEMNQQFMFAQEDFDPRYFDRGDDRTARVHPSVLLQMAANTKSPSFKLAPGTGSILSEAETTTCVCRLERAPLPRTVPRMGVASGGERPAATATCSSATARPSEGSKPRQPAPGR